MFAAVAATLGLAGMASAADPVKPLSAAAIITGAITTAASRAPGDTPAAIQIAPLDLRTLDASAFGDWDGPVDALPGPDDPVAKR